MLRNSSRTDDQHSWYILFKESKEDEPLQPSRESHVEHHTGGFVQKLQFMWKKNRFESFLAVKFVTPHDLHQ
jgi:hypothetical protein